MGAAAGPVWGHRLGRAERVRGGHTVAGCLMGAAIVAGCEQVCVRDGQPVWTHLGRCAGHACAPPWPDSTSAAVVWTSALVMPHVQLAPSAACERLPW